MMLLTLSSMINGVFDMNLSNEAILIITLLVITVLPCLAVWIGITTGSLKECDPTGNSNDDDWDY